ncbi:MAG: hypothetical protein ACPHX8_03480 [Candidatus Poseidoniaceae archaeon]
MNSKQSAFFLCILMMFVPLTSLPVAAAGPAAQVVITTPSTSISSDGVLQLDATIYDALNNVVEGEITWSSTNGTVEEGGLFFPWSAGQVTIRAEHAGFNDTVVLTVEAGWGQSIEINTTASPKAKQPFELQANLLDSHGNPRSGQGVVWSVDGEYVGQGQPLWTPPALGLYEVIARFDQMEQQVMMEATAGDPFEFRFEENLVIRSGFGIKLDPTLVDSFGQEMNDTLAGMKAWTAENGSITSEGYFFASAPGFWNISVRAGAIFGNGTIRVIPADAAIVSIQIVPEQTTYQSGEVYRLDAVRTDSNGYTSPVPVPIGNWSVGNGAVAQVGDEVHWTPGKVGSFTMEVVDSDVGASKAVSVIHGSAISTHLVASLPRLSAGLQVALVHEATDAFGNIWQIDGNISKISNDQSTTEIFSSYATFTPKLTEAIHFSATYFDNSTGILHQCEYQEYVEPGRLAFIILPESGTEVKADSYLQFDPTFTDSYGNTIGFVAVNWTIDGVDSTLDLLMSNGKWYPTEVGEHEIRANADGVFAAVRINVITGSENTLSTDAGDSLRITAGVPSDLYVEIVDVHGNVAPAEEVELVESGFISIEPSATGRGYWQLDGVTSGTYEVELQQGNASILLPLTILPGNPVRVLTSVSNESLSQGEVTLLMVWAEDSQGNRVEVVPEQTSITCSSGKASHVKSDTWEIELEEAGTDRSCTVAWSGLISQQFYDVESVLLGGALGSTNTAMSIGLVFLLMIFAVLIVLIRRGSSKEEEWDEYDDEYEYEDEYEGGEEDAETSAESDAPVEQEANTPPQTTSTESAPIIEDALRQELAGKATQIGVMQAAPGTNQGETGWYVDASTELQQWNVGSDGSWSRLQ